MNIQVIRLSRHECSSEVTVGTFTGALKNLLDRQEYQNRENDKKIKVLELERDRLLSSSPRKAGYEKEVSSLRDEITVLRRRAEDAIEQKTKSRRA